MGTDQIFLPFHQLNGINSVKKFDQSRWPQLSKTAVTSYTIGEYKDSLLETESDFCTIKWILGRGVFDKVYIYVTDSRTPSFNNISSPESHGITKPIAAEPIQSVVASTPDPAYFIHEKKAMLSDSWKLGLQGVGQCFVGGAEQFRSVLCKQAAVDGFDFDYIHNNKNSRISAQCFYKVETGCKWYIYVSRDKSNGFWYLRTYRNNHTCGHVYKKTSHSRLDSSILSRVIYDELRSKPASRPREIQSVLKESYGFDISYKTSWSTIHKAKDNLYGDIGSSFNRLQAYFEKLQKLDPNTAFSVQCDPESRVFHRCFFAFGGSITGFKSCRPMLFLDSTFLKSKYKGSLFVATAKDGDQGLFPVAFGVVPGEDTNNSTAFLQFLKPLVEGRPLTFISDCHKGLVNGVRDVLPQDSHGHCIKNIEKNLRLAISGSTFYRDRMVYLLKQVAHAPTIAHYDQQMAKFLFEGKKPVKDFLKGLPRENYANAYFPGRRYGEMTSNAVESFNYWILGQRGLPVCELVDSFRVKLMQWIYERSLKSSKWTSPLCPAIMELYNTNVGLSCTWTFKQSTTSLFQVGSNPIMVVDIDARTCSCCEWKELGFPCQHALCALSSVSVRDPFVYVESYFHTSSYQKTYANSIPPKSTFQVEVPVPESQIILAPEVRVQPGRPQTKRFRSCTEKVVRPIRCGNCKKVGHSISTCRAPPK